VPVQPYQWLPPEGVKIIVVLFLSFLTGLEREEHKAGAERFSFGGVRTFPLIGLLGYSLALLSGPQLVPVALGLAAVAAFLLLSYQRKLTTSGTAGITSEMSGLTTYVVGALVSHEEFWIATALTVASALLLELKTVLEGLTKRIAPEEILTFTKFLLLTAVILPILPNKDFGPFQINPFKTWLVVVAVSTVSYGSYVLQQVSKERGGVILAAILGGAYSSTVTTVALARRAAREERPHLFAGGILVASGVMYLRLIALIGMFNLNLMKMVALPFAALAALAAGGGWLWSRIPDASSEAIKREFEPTNPLELRVAFLFALIFLAMLVATHVAVVYLGKAGVYTLAAIMGVTDVDPFVMGMTQSTGTLTGLPVAAMGIVIAVASNNVVKGIYAYSLCDRRTAIQSLGLMIVLAVLGVTPLLWLAQ
jgi:uncharacterized membrane protein (DUF4010 family)